MEFNIEHTSANASMAIEDDQVTISVNDSTNIEDITMKETTDGVVISVEITSESETEKPSSTGSDLTEKKVDSASETTKQSKREGEKDQLPEVPVLTSEQKESASEDDLRRYDQLSSTSTQAYDVRRIVWEEGRTTREKIKERMNEMGYDSVKPGEQHTGVHSTLRVLEQLTGEVERRGRGDSKTIEWVGSE